MPEYILISFDDRRYVDEVTEFNYSKNAIWSKSDTD